jgi:hypothetical protein
MRRRENLISGKSNIIRSLLKVIGFIAFILPGANVLIEAEPLLLLLFGLLLYSVAIGIKLKLLER